MLRSLTPSSAAAFAPVRPRSHARPSVFTPLPAATQAVRGHLRNGSAAAAILEPASICLVSADRARRRCVRRYAIAEVLAVDEHRTVAGAELTVLTAHGSLTIVDVEVGQAWMLCRALRQLILAGSRAIES